MSSGCQHILSGSACTGRLWNLGVAPSARTLPAGGIQRSLLGRDRAQSPFSGHHCRRIPGLSYNGRRRSTLAGLGCFDSRNLGACGRRLQWAKLGMGTADGGRETVGISVTSSGENAWFAWSCFGYRKRHDDGSSGVWAAAAKCLIYGCSKTLRYVMTETPLRSIEPLLQSALARSGSNVASLEYNVYRAWRCVNGSAKVWQAATAYLNWRTVRPISYKNRSIEHWGSKDYHGTEDPEASQYGYNRCYRKIRKPIDGSHDFRDLARYADGCPTFTLWGFAKS